MGYIDTVVRKERKDADNGTYAEHFTSGMLLINDIVFSSGVSDINDAANLHRELLELFEELAWDTGDSHSAIGAAFDIALGAYVFAHDYGEYELYSKLTRDPWTFIIGGIDTNKVSRNHMGYEDAYKVYALLGEYTERERGNCES